MSSVTPSDVQQNSSQAPKKKNNKKKKGLKTKSNGDLKDQEVEVDHPAEVADADVEVEESGQSTANTPHEAHFPEAVEVYTNGHINDPATNGHPAESQSQSPLAGESIAQEIDKPVESMRSNTSETTDPSIRFEVMSQEREALRAEVEQLRKSLEDIQGKHREEISTVASRHSEEISTIQGKHIEDVAQIKSQYAEELSTLKTELEESETAKDQAETQYQNLFGRVNTIRASLGERLKADRQELSEAKDQIEELEAQNESLQNRVQSLEADTKRLEAESAETSKELSTLRNRHNLSQQNWVNEREDLIQQTAQLKDEADAAKEAMGDWEVLAMEERSMRESLTERIADIEEQFDAQKEAYESILAERDTQSQTVSGLQRALQEVQDARKRELRDMVESYEEQVQSLKKLVQESDSRATKAEASTGSLEKEVERIAPFEDQVKEKNLLIGKLRHEAIILNDHLTKALRFLKKGKPEDNVDRQVVTNHFLHFLALDRSDPKKFQILQLIALLLNWTEEQREQAGLARPGASTGSLRLPASPFHRTPSTPSLSSEFYTDNSASKESLADLWTGFLERSAEEGSSSESRSASVSATRPEPRGGENSRG